MSEYEDLPESKPDPQYEESAAIFTGQNVEIECNEHPMYQTLQTKFAAVKEENAELRQRLENLEKINFERANQMKPNELCFDDVYTSVSRLDCLRIFLREPPDARFDIGWRNVNKE